MVRPSSRILRGHQKDRGLYVLIWTKVRNILLRKSYKIVRLTGCIFVRTKKNKTKIVCVCEHISRTSLGPYK